VSGPHSLSFGERLAGNGDDQNLDVLGDLRARRSTSGREERDCRRQRGAEPNRSGPLAPLPPGRSPGPRVRRRSVRPFTSTRCPRRVHAPPRAKAQLAPRRRELGRRAARRAHLDHVDACDRPASSCANLTAGRNHLLADRAELIGTRSSRTTPAAEAARRKDDMLTIPHPGPTDHEVTTRPAMSQTGRRASPACVIMARRTTAAVRTAPITTHRDGRPAHADPERPRKGRRNRLRHAQPDHGELRGREQRVGRRS